MAGAVAAVSTRMPWASDNQDAIALLETEHRRLEQLLAQGEETTERAVNTRTELLKTLTTELERHELIERGGIAVRPGSKQPRDIRCSH